MVQRASDDGSLLAGALTRVPDLPRWVDTRGMLLSGRAVVHAEGPDLSHFVAVVPDAALASVVGRPSATLVAGVVASLAGDVNVLCQMEDADAVAAALPGWRRHRALLHTQQDGGPTEDASDTGVRIFGRDTAPAFDHVPTPLRAELRDALNGRTVSRFVPGLLPAAGGVAARVAVPMAAVWADGRPVAFCYPVWQTETLWDVSIETLPAYRQRGLGRRAARTLIRHMRARGCSPVWGALESNTASRRLAASLGFAEAAGIVVFTAAASPSTSETSPRRTPPRAAG